MAAEGDGGRTNSPISSPPDTGYDDFGFQRPKWQLDMGSNGVVLYEVEGNKKSRLILISFEEVVDSIMTVQ